MRLSLLCQHCIQEFAPITHEEAKAIVSSWAGRYKVIRRVYFYESRVRKEHRAESDLDIAIELIFPDPDT